MNYSAIGSQIIFLAIPHNSHIPLCLLPRMSSHRITPNRKCFDPIAGNSEVSQQRIKTKTASAINLLTASVDFTAGLCTDTCTCSSGSKFILVIRVPLSVVEDTSFVLGTRLVGLYSHCIMRWERYSITITYTQKRSTHA